MTSSIDSVEARKKDGLCINCVSVTLSSNARTIPVLDSFSATVSPGEIVAVMGRSGSGKSTLLNVVAGFVSPTQGSVSFAGLAIEALRQQGLLAYQNQKPLLLPWLTIRQNLTVVDEVLRSKAPEAEEVLARFIHETA